MICSSSPPAQLGLRLDLGWLQRVQPDLFPCYNNTVRVTYRISGGEPLPGKSVGCFQLVDWKPLAPTEGSGLAYGAESHILMETFLYPGNHYCVITHHLKKLWGVWDFLSRSAHRSFSWTHTLNLLNANEGENPSITSSWSTHENRHKKKPSTLGSLWEQ